MIPRRTFLGSAAASLAAPALSVADAPADRENAPSDLPPTPNVAYSAALMSKAEEAFTTGKAACPIARTLLAGGVIEAGLQSLAGGQKRLETPHLADVKYNVGEESLFWHR